MDKKTKKQTRSNIKDINKRRKIALISIIVFVIAIYCIYKVVKLVQNPTDTFSVEQGKIYQEESVVGYIIREETVVKGSNYKNGMVQIKTEGEKTAKGEAVYRYYSKNEENLKKQISELDVQIQEALKGQTNILEKQKKI